MSDLKWGIIGTGAIASEFAAALNSGGLILEGVASRSADKAENFARKFNANRFFSSYEQLMECPEIDIVYVATPHNLHCEWAEKALAKGKHVLCEKAITVNGEELDRLCSRAREKKLVLREAMTIYHMPLFEKLRNMVGEGTPLGAVKTMEIAFGSFKEYDPKNRFFNPDLAGGAILDIGVYALSFARMFMAEAPDSIVFIRTDGESGVDEEWGIALKNRFNQTATLNIALRTKLPKRAVIGCERGYVTVYDYPRADKAEIVWTADGKREEIAEGRSCDALLYEAISVENAVKNGESGEFMTFTCDVMEIMDKLRK